MYKDISLFPCYLHCIHDTYYTLSENSITYQSLRTIQLSLNVTRGIVAVTGRRAAQLEISTDKEVHKEVADVLIIEGFSSQQLDKDQVVQQINGGRPHY